MDFPVSLLLSSYVNLTMLPLCISEMVFPLWYISALGVLTKTLVSTIQSITRTFVLLTLQDQHCSKLNRFSGHFIVQRFPRSSVETLFPSVIRISVNWNSSLKLVSTPLFPLNQTSTLSLPTLPQKLKERARLPSAPLRMPGQLQSLSLSDREKIL